MVVAEFVAIHFVQCPLSTLVRYASDDRCFWWSVLLMILLLMTCLQELFFRLVSSDAFFRRSSSDSFFQMLYASNKFLCSWTCSIRIFMNSTLIMDPVHLNKLFSISNWLFLIPCYCQNSIGDLWNTLCSNNLPFLIMTNTSIKSINCC